MKNFAYILSCFLTFHSYAQNVDIALSSIENHYNGVIAVHCTLTTTQSNIESIDEIYTDRQLNSTFNRSYIKKSVNFPVSFEHIIRTTSSGDLIAIFNHTSRIVKIASQNELSLTAASFGSFASFASALRDFSSDISYSTSPLGFKLVCTLNMNKLENFGLIDASSPQINLVIEAKNTGEIVKTTFKRVGYADTITTYVFHSTKVNEISNFLDELEVVSETSISQNITYPEALIDEMEAISAANRSKKTKK